MMLTFNNKALTCFVSRLKITLLGAALLVEIYTVISIVSGFYHLIALNADCQKCILDTGTGI